MVQVFFILTQSPAKLPSSDTFLLASISFWHEDISNETLSWEGSKSAINWSNSNQNISTQLAFLTWLTIFRNYFQLFTELHSSSGIASLVCNSNLLGYCEKMLLFTNTDLYLNQDQYSQFLWRKNHSIAHFSCTRETYRVYACKYSQWDWHVLQFWFMVICLKFPIILFSTFTCH